MGYRCGDVSPLPVLLLLGMIARETLLRFQFVHKCIYGSGDFGSGLEGLQWDRAHDDNGSRCSDSAPAVDRASPLGLGSGWVGHPAPAALSLHRLSLSSRAHRRYGLFFHWPIFVELCDIRS